MPIKAIPVYFKESQSEPVNFCRKIHLDIGVTLLFDNLRGIAEGSDGKTYHPVCRELPGPEGDIEVLGWSTEADGETFLRAETT